MKVPFQIDVQHQLILALKLSEWKDQHHLILPLKLSEWKDHLLHEIRRYQ